MTTQPLPTMTEARLASALTAALRALIRANGTLAAIADIDDPAAHAEWIRTATNSRTIETNRAINAAHDVWLDTLPPGCPRYLSPQD